MKRYAKIEKNENGLLVKVAGCLQQDKEPAPEGYVEMTPDQEIKLNNGYYVKDLETMELEEIPEHVPTAEELLSAAKQPKLAELQNYLDATDYEAIKYAEGAISEAEYADTKSLRVEWRTAYNVIEEAQTVDEVAAIIYTKKAV